MAEEKRPRPPLWRRRWVWAVVVLIVLVRVALPEVVRRVLVSQVSSTLKTRVEVGDVDLALHRGGVALEDVALYSPTPEAPDEPPLVAWKRFAVELRWVPLLWKTIQLRTIALDGPHVALDRLADGELNLRRLIPVSEPVASAPAPEAEKAPSDEVKSTTPEGAKPSGWKVGVDRFQLTAGGVRFRDLTIHEGEPLEIALPDISVNDVALQPGLYGEPARVRLRVKSEGGAVRIDAQLWTLEKGFALATRVRALNLPLRRARLYVPGVGWSEVQGHCDAALDYGLAPAPGEHNEVRGIVRLRDVAVRIPGLEQAAFGLRRLAVRVDPIDLIAQRAMVRSVDITGASIVANLQGGEVLPLLQPVGARTSPSPSAEPPPAAAAPPARPWHWHLGSLTLGDSRVSLLQEGAPLDIGVEVAARDLADQAERPGHLDVKLAVAPGSVAVAGAVRVAPPGFGGTVRIQQLPVHDLVRAARAAAQLPPGLLKAALLGTDLVIEAGLDERGATASDAHALRLRGKITADGLHLASGDPKEFSVGWKSLEVPIDELRMSGALPGSPDAAKAEPLRVALGAVRLEEPVVQVTRTAQGIVLPPPFGHAPANPSEPPPAEPAPAAVKSPPAGPGDSAARKIDGEVSSFTLRRGQIGFTDRTVKPFFQGTIKPLDVEAQGIKLDGPVVKRFTLSAVTPQKGKIDVTGSLGAQGGTIDVTAKDVALSPYNPFVTSLSSYSLGGKSGLTVHTKVVMTKGRYDTNTSFSLHRLVVKGAQGDTLFKQQFGIPLTMALALMRDLNGDIKLDVPVTVDQSGTTIALGTVVAGALKAALLGAVTAPLKMVGAALGGGDGTIESPSIPFPTGRSVLTPEGEEQVGKLAEFLAGRPGLTLELDGVVTQADVRWLAEQDLRTELDTRKGVVNALRGLPGRGGRMRVQQALAERAQGGAGELSAEDVALLDQWLAERPPVPAERAKALATERANVVATRLREQHGIPAERVTVGEAPGEPVVDGKPAVEVALGAVGD